MIIIESEGSLLSFRQEDISFVGIKSNSNNVDVILKNGETVTVRASDRGSANSIFHRLISE